MRTWPCLLTTMSPTNVEVYRLSVLSTEDSNRVCLVHYWQKKRCFLGLSTRATLILLGTKVQKIIYLYRDITFSYTIFMWKMWNRSKLVIDKFGRAKHSKAKIGQLFKLSKLYVNVPENIAL